MYRNLIILEKKRFEYYINNINNIFRFGAFLFIFRLYIKA